MSAEQETPQPEAAETRPLLKVVNPDATPEEVAAIVAVLSALGGGAPEKPQPVSEWASPARNMRGAPVLHHASWRASGLPR